MKVHAIDLATNTQKEEWFLRTQSKRANPWSSSIAIRMETGKSGEADPGFPVFETGAIMVYLGREDRATDAERIR